MSIKNNIKSNIIGDEFWLDDPSILYRNGNYMEVIPTAEMTRTEQLNAITRVSIYVILILLLFGSFGIISYMALVLIVFIVVIYNVYINDPEGKRKELVKKKSIYEQEHFSSLTSDIYTDEPEYAIETGNYDSNGELQLMGDYDVFTKPIEKEKELYYTFDEMENYNRATCKQPTADNPFMNPEIKEYNTEDPPVACDADDDEIKNMIEERFNDNLFMDIDDLFTVKNSQRQFYTIPVPAIPNNQTEFANWLYRNEATCKEDNMQCYNNQYEDLRFKRHI